MSANFADVADKTFDYIIVGAGAAGLLLAAELSRDPGVSVLVLESGRANIDDPVLLRPASYGAHFGNELYAWNHQTTQQAFSDNRVYPWARGKGLGGSTCINFMAYTKPPAEEIDDWERLGNPGWNWEALQKVLIPIEGFVPPSADVQENFNIHPESWDIGRDGPLLLSFPGYMDANEVLLQQTLENAGVPRAPQPLNGNTNGYFFAPLTYDSRTHTRSYATPAFYTPNKHRPNLTVLVLAHVHKVLTEMGKDGKLRATGVVFGHEHNVHTVNAKAEVVLSAGACKTPQLLELSGIGRRDVLEKIGVPLKLELPGVGENVQEHLIIGASWELKDDVDFQTIDPIRDPAIAEKQMELYREGKGIFTMGITNFAFGTLDMCSPRAEEIYQNIRAMTSSLDQKTFPPGLMEQYEIQAERFKPGAGAPSFELIFAPAIMSYPNPPTPEKRYITVMTGMNNLLSRGTIHCTSNDPDIDPHYDPHYFEKQADIDAFVEMVKFSRSLARIAPFSEMITGELNPGPDVKSDDDIKHWIMQCMNTTWHTASSCSMLPKEKNGVVDTNLKVYGTSNLRVVDLSIAPLHFASHTQSVTYAIAAKASDIIKQERAEMSA